MENNKLLTEWMERNGYTNRTLSEAIGLSYDLIYKITSGERPVSDGFRWRFAQKFGWDEAVALFGEPDNEETPDPVVAQTPGA